MSELGRSVLGWFGEGREPFGLLIILTLMTIAIGIAISFRARKQEQLDELPLFEEPICRRVQKRRRHIENVTNRMYNVIVRELQRKEYREGCPNPAKHENAFSLTFQYFLGSTMEEYAGICVEVQDKKEKPQIVLNWHRMGYKRIQMVFPVDDGSVRRAVDYVLGCARAHAA